MANKIIALVKRNPKASALIAVGVVAVIYLVSRSGSSSTASDTGDGYTYGTGQYTDSQMAYALQVQQTQAAVTSQQNQTNAELTALNVQYDYQTHVADLQAQTDQLALSYSYQAALQDSADTRYAQDSAADIAKLQLSYENQVANKSLDYANASAIAQNTILANQVDYTHQENMATIDASYNLGMASIDSTNFVAQLQSNTTMYLADKQTELGKYQAYQQYKIAQKTSKYSLLNNIVSTVGSVATGGLSTMFSGATTSGAAVTGTTS